MFEQKEFTRLEMTVAMLRGCINSMAGADADDKTKVYELYVYAQKLLCDLVEEKLINTEFIKGVLKMFEKVEITKLNNPVDGKYHFNAQIFRSVDGTDFYYCGEGKFFETMAEAEKYKKEIEA